MNARSFGIPLASLALAAGTACIDGEGGGFGADPIEGEWLGNEANFGNGYTYAFPYTYTNSDGTTFDLDLNMDIGYDLSGTLRFYSDVTEAGQPTETYTYTYSVDALSNGDRTYEISLVSSDARFDLSCALLDDDDELDCDGTNGDGDSVFFNFLRGATY